MEQLERSTAAFSHVALSVVDLDRCAAFYCGALDFTRGTPYAAAGRRVGDLMGVSDARFQGLFLRLGPFLLELLSYAHSELPATGLRAADAPGLAHLSLIVPDVEAVATRVRAHGGRLLTRMSHGFAGGGTDMAFCADPEGNRIELVAHPHDDERRGHAGFLGLTELGWPGLRQCEPA